ncbi:enoyl-CoA hydratase/isomerase family protein [Nocardia bovistercoris]|uniref:Enoyl-CoA hydratase/isomerase family protein n=1 Tax=Nocardia bovistercoris TaxID=2785916 RepID=A0A931N1U0_9NOCA|nr:enoyl-CoA hydratase/isomerase family protein [Nocardia bovistercoris]MBH0775296.1 enoyl-CoA hydratase/isomerase family protein [Nocardia bovistercoris]
MAAGSVLLIEQDDDGVGLVTLNRPDALNAANEELHGAIAAVWSELATRSDLRAVVLTGAGKAFSAGGDLPLLDRMTRDLDLRARIMAEAAMLVRDMTGLPVPIVSAVNGPAVGLGCSLASLSDLVVMTEDAYFADPHVSLGLVAGDGGALTWPLNMGVQRAKEWLLLGGRIAAHEAFSFGLANRVVAPGEAVAEAKKLARKLANLPPQALRETRRVLNQPLVARIDAALDDILAAETNSFDEPAFQRNLTAMIGRSRA